MYGGSINTPVHILNQIENERQAIADLEEELKQAVAETPADAPLPAEKRGRDPAVQALDDRDWDNLLRRIRDGNCTPFLGSGLTEGLLPSAREIAQTWVADYGYPLSDNDNLSRVAQFLAITRDSIFPADDIARRLQSSTTRPNFHEAGEPYSFLASLPLPLYITTNYDDFMVQALQYQQRQPYQELCRWNRYVRDLPSIFDPDSTVEVSATNPVVYHLFGYAQAPESLVLTEDDYLDFLVNVSRDSIIPRYIEKALVNTSLLFIGYDVADRSFQTLFRGLIASLERSLRRTRIIQLLTPESPKINSFTADRVRGYVEDYLAKDDVRVYWGDPTSFTQELMERWRQFSNGA
jgi:hypothetical protein